MRWLLLGKVSIWLIIIGTVALVTPNPAWPEWLARMVLATGFALGLTTVGVRIWKGRGTGTDQGDREGR